MRQSQSRLGRRNIATGKIIQSVVGRLVPLLTIAILLLISGCGGGGGGSSSSGSTTQVTVAVSPSSVTLAPGATKTFTATVTGAVNLGVSWSCSGGTIDQSGHYTAPTAQAFYTVTATSLADPTAKAVAQITVVQTGVSVSISPATASIGVGAQQQFTATVTGSSNTAVTWSATGGTIDANGLYTAPTTTGLYRVTATSAASSSATATASVNVSGASLQVTPSAPTVGTDGTIQFTATFFNSSNQSVTWSATGGTINSSGLYQAAEVPGTFAVTATSTTNPALTQTVPVTIKNISVTVTPNPVTVVTGQNQQFSAQVTGPATKGVTWSATAGTITSAGLFTAPATAQTVTVTAVSLDDPNKSATSTVTVATPSSFFYDFNNGVPAVWTPTTNEKTPSGVSFLGRISGTNTAQLVLDNLTPHTTISVTFDLYVIGAWGGIPSSNTLAVTIGGTSAFSQSFSNQLDILQSYPLSGSNAPGTGSTAQNSLGYTSDPAILYNDTTYHITCSAAHTASSVTIVFTGNLTGTLSQMAWGLKNVTVTANP